MSGVVNPSAASALRTLDTTETRLDRALSQAATGKAVATVADDPAAYVIASHLNSDAQAFLAVKSLLGGAAVPTRVAAAAVNSTSDILMKPQSTVFEAQSGGEATAAANTQVQSLLSQIANNAADATVNGVNLVAGAVVNDVKVTQINVPRNLNGGTVTIGDKGLSQMNASLPGLGLDNFLATSDGIKIAFSSVGREHQYSTTGDADRSANRQLQP
jgi:flagellin-like hook-associated protein FlgL